MEHNFPFGYSGWEFLDYLSTRRSVYFGYFPVGQAKIALPFKIQPKFLDFFVNG